MLCAEAIRTSAHVPDDERTLLSDGHADALTDLLEQRGVLAVSPPPRAPKPTVCGAMDRGASL